LKNVKVDSSPIADPSLSHLFEDDEMDKEFDVPL
jgi:hypothetical protein